MLTGEEDQLLHAFRRIKNVELRGCILKLVGNVTKRAKQVTLCVLLVCNSQ